MKKYIVGEDLKQGSECIILDNVVHKMESECIHPDTIRHDCGVEYRLVKPKRELPEKMGQYIDWQSYVEKGQPLGIISIVGEMFRKINEILDYLKDLLDKYI